MSDNRRENSGPALRTNLFMTYWREAVAIGLFVVFFILFSIISDGFISTEMLSIILLNGAELGIISIGMALLIIAGEIDLSVASVFVFSNYVLLSFSNMGLPLSVSFVIALLYGVLAGFVNGYLTLKFRVASFIVTFGTLIFWRAAVAGLTNGEPTYFEGDKGSVFFDVLGGKFGFIPKQFLWFLGFAIVFSVLLNHTKFGNHLMATGGNTETARALGINTGKVKMLCFVISSTLSAFAGAAYLVRSSYLDPVVAIGTELEAVASAVIGGTLLTGGIGSVAATTISAFLVKEIQIGIATYGIRVEFYRVVVGILLVIAAIINNQMTKRILKL